MQHFSWTENFFLSPDWLDGTNHSISLDVAFCADMLIEVIREIEIMCQSQFETNELRLNACSVFRETVIICLKMAEYGKKILYSIKLYGFIHHYYVRSWTFITSLGDLYFFYSFSLKWYIYRWQIFSILEEQLMKDWCPKRLVFFLNVT